jgi:hypothetical protein
VVAIGNPITSVAMVNEDQLDSGLAALTVSTTFRIRAGGSTGAHDDLQREQLEEALFGGTLLSYIRVRELMA